MYAVCWSDSLRQRMQSLNRLDPRIAVVGVGQEMRGDDAVGLIVAQRLLAIQPQHPSLLVVEGGHAPENCTGILRRFGPELVVLVDAAALDLHPGSIQLLNWEEISGLSATTHAMPLHLLARYLMAELNCQVVMVGIQPIDTTLGAALSSPVEKAIQEVVEGLEKLCDLVNTPPNHLSRSQNHV